MVFMMRLKKLNKVWSGVNVGDKLLFVLDMEPLTFHEAITSNEKDKWWGAMDDEMASLHKNHTWKLVDRPVDEKIVLCKWLYNIKEGQRYKARLVAKGFTQRPCIDYKEIFSPVVTLFHKGVAIVDCSFKP